MVDKQDMFKSMQNNEQRIRARLYEITTKTKHKISIIRIVTWVRSASTQTGGVYTKTQLQWMLPTFHGMGSSEHKHHWYLIAHDSLECLTLDYGPKVYNIFTEGGAAALIKEIDKRIGAIAKRIEMKAKIASRKTEIGRFNGDDGETIQSAVFEVYLDANKEINEADVQTTGKVKFFKKASRPCIFDIDKRQIFASDGSLIEAKNSDMVIDALIKCLGDMKDT